MLTKYELSPQEIMLLNSEVRPREKSLALAYLMLLGGHLGVHRFYLKRIASAIIQLVLFLIASASYVGWALLMEFNETASFAILFVFILSGLSLFVWIVIDLFLIPRMVRNINTNAEQEVLQQIEWLRQNPPAPRGQQGMQPQSQPPYTPPSN